MARLVSEDKRAWHAGVSYWRGATDINDRSVGIELVNPGHEFGYRPFPEAQMAALENLLHNILARHGIDPARVVGHSDIAPARKQDLASYSTGERLATAGLAIWPDAAAERSIRRPYPAPSPQLATIPAQLLDDAVTAFQRRFVPARC